MFLRSLVVVLGHRRGRAQRLQPFPWVLLPSSDRLLHGRDFFTEACGRALCGQPSFSRDAMHSKAPLSSARPVAGAWNQVLRLMSWAFGHKAPEATSPLQLHSCFVISCDFLISDFCFFTLFGCERQPDILLCHVCSTSAHMCPSLWC